MNLTHPQRRAVERAGRSLQLIACAGSGKTEVVARRVVHLLTPGRPGSLRPANIIAFTFTEKAAAELKERIVTRTRQALGDLPGLAEMFVGTIHAFCLELLKSESPEHLNFGEVAKAKAGLADPEHTRWGQCSIHAVVGRFRPGSGSDHQRPYAIGWRRGRPGSATTHAPPRSAFGD